MSLLLDALKKAAKDKQNTSAQSEDERSAKPKDIDRQNNDELVLDLDESLEAVEENAESVAAAVATALHDDMPVDPVVNTEQAHTTTYTVSDEALHMLIYKTNREHRRKQKMILGAVAAVSAFVLLIGGYYFYNNMISDIESLEREHRIAIQKINADVINQKRPELIDGLTDNTVIEKKAPVQKAVQSSKDAKQTAADKPADKIGMAISNTTQKTEAPQFIRSKRVDPVSDLLQRGWHAYNRSDYSTAKQMYQDVLQSEANNRDALLGMAAIAMQQGRYDEAKSYYTKLLLLDPRDPIAVAALATLKPTEVMQDGAAGQQLSELSESRLKMLLKQRPDSAHINFALGNISAQQKKWPQAQAYYYDAWVADKSNPDYAFNLAVSLDQLGKSEQAIRFYRHSLALTTSKNHSFSVETVMQRLKTLEQ